MKMALIIAQIITALLLILSIMLQQKGGGLSLGGDAMQQYRSRRGAEQLLFKVTIGLSVLLTVIAIATAFL